MRDVNQRRWNELQQIKRQNGGLLKPEGVVEFARNAETALHSAFTWDDGRAAHLYRLVEARALIRVMVGVLPESAEPVRLAVSIKEDRHADGGGYRFTHDVMADPALRQKMVQTALAELSDTRRRYKTLTELAHIFEAIDVATKEHATTEARAA